MSFISFLIKGTQCPLLQEMQLDKQLSLVTIMHGEDQRNLDKITIADTYGRNSQFQFSIIARSEEPLITVDYNCIDEAEQIWRNFHRKTLYALIATTALLAGLVTLSLSGVVTTRLIIVAQVVTAVFCVVAFARTDELYRSKPPFPSTYSDYTSAIHTFRNEVIKKGWHFLTNESSWLPYELQDRKAEFFTQNEKTFLEKV